MTAQQQLVSMLASRDETGHVPATAVDFIRDHGPAIAELIEAAAALLYGDSHKPLVERNTDHFRAALRKLTQDET